MTKTKISRIALFLFFGLLMNALPAVAASEESVRSAIEAQINQRHPSLPNGFWEGLGDGAVPVIKKMYLENESAHQRTFLIDGLSHYKTEEAARFLESQVKGTGNEVLKKKLLSAIVQNEGEASLEFVEPYLKDEDGHIRAAVAKELAVHSSNEKVRKRLEKFRQEEKTLWVAAAATSSSPQGIQRVRRPTEMTAEPKMSLPVVARPAAPLAEKDWAGTWKGSWVGESKIVMAEAELTILDPKTPPLKWKATFTLPGKIKQEWKTNEFKLNYFQTDGAHWIEVRNLKLNTVFLASKKAK